MFNRDFFIEGIILDLKILFNKKFLFVLFYLLFNREFVLLIYFPEKEYFLKNPSENVVLFSYK